MYENCFKKNRWKFQCIYRPVLISILFLKLWVIKRPDGKSHGTLCSLTDSNKNLLQLHMNTSTTSVPELQAIFHATFIYLASVWRENRYRVTMYGHIVLSSAHWPPCALSHLSNRIYISYIFICSCRPRYIQCDEVLNVIMGRQNLIN